ncbi:MAG: hypothetical protein HRU20_27805, partial [Pseudomonadales bacterium]|nr:hypothetical protein [Pseudomonadales bacterium]
KAIGQEFSLTMTNRDFTVYEKYLYQGRKITIDIAPANNRGEKDLSYDDYMKMEKMSISIMGDTEIYDELLSITVDK